MNNALRMDYHIYLSRTDQKANGPLLPQSLYSSMWHCQWLPFAHIQLDARAFSIVTCLSSSLSYF